jgi:N-acyl-D-amino-acid deacylase
VRGRLALLCIAALACKGAPSADAPAGTLLTGARVVDGSGRPAVEAAVRIAGDRIVAVGDLAPLPGEAVIDLSGLVLAPGFIDTHSHHDRGLHENPDAVAAVSQGITTIVVGNDGGSPALPLSDFFDRFEAAPAALNVASYSGHGTLRRRVLGADYRRAATAEEVARMAALLTADLEAGALGLSTGLEYDPGIYAETEEVIALARVAAAHGGRYISHIRSEDRYFRDAVEEILRIGREADLPVQISHLKLAMRSLWGTADALLARLDSARAAGVRITADVYPYPYWQSTLTVLFPRRDFEDLDEARLVLAEIVPPEGVLVTAFAPEPEYAGLTLDVIAARRGEEPAVALLALIREAEAMRAAGPPDGVRVESMIGTSMAESDIEAILRWPHVNFCTDGELMGAHPRGFGSFPRILGRYVRERGILTLEEAVRRATSLAAENMGMERRGLIRAGYAADLVAFDPAAVIDRATPAEPHALSEGIIGVWVAGRRVWDEGRPTGERPGRVLRRTPQRDTTVRTTSPGR